MKSSLIILFVFVLTSGGATISVSQPHTEGLVGYWPFNGNANDESGNGHDGTVVGATLTEDRFGNPESAYNFDGVDDRIDYPVLWSTPPDAVTMVGWFYAQSSSGIHHIIYHGNNGEIRLKVDGGNAVFDCKFSDGLWSVPVEEPVENDRWYFMTGIWKKGVSLRLYLDGVLADSVLSPDLHLFDPASGYPPSIGSYQRSSRYFSGVLDDIRVYDRALTDEDIQMLFEEDGGIPCSSVDMFQTRCNASDVLQARVLFLNSTIYEGEDVVFGVDGLEYHATVITNGVDSKAQIQLSATTGEHVISLLNPGGCLPDQVANCGRSAGPENHWYWDDGWANVSGPSDGTPATTQLLANYPNPFNPTTSISYQLSSDSRVQVKVYDMLGREVTTLVDGWKEAGAYTAVWNGKNSEGENVSSGVYVYRMVAGNYWKMKKMILAK